MASRAVNTALLFLLAALLLTAGCLIKYCLVVPMRTKRRRLPRARPHGKAVGEEHHGQHPSSMTVTTIFTREALNQIYSSFSDQLVFDKHDVKAHLLIDYESWSSSDSLPAERLSNINHHLEDNS